MKSQSVSISILVILLITAGGAVLVLRSNSGSNLAPSYEEIRETVYHITKRDIDPRGPEVGPDGIIDIEIKKGVADYRRALKGKRVEGWQGWYAGYTEIEPNKSYNVAVYMQEPKTGVRKLTDVLIVGVPFEQVSNLKALQEGQGVVFSGTIGSVLSDGKVEIYYSIIAPAQ